MYYQLQLAWRWSNRKLWNKMYTLPQSAFHKFFKLKSALQYLCWRKRKQMSAWKLGQNWWKGPFPSHLILKIYFHKYWKWEAETKAYHGWPNNLYKLKQSHGKIFYVFTMVIPMPINHIAVEISLFGLLSFSDTSIAYTQLQHFEWFAIQTAGMYFLCLSQETNLDIWLVTSLALSLSLFLSVSRVCLQFKLGKNYFN